MRHSRWVTPCLVFCLTCWSLFGCSDDGSGSSASSDATQEEDNRPAPDATLVSASKLNAAVSNGERADGKENAALPDGLFERAQLVEVKAELVGDRELAPDDGLVGQQTTISYDIDEDGVDESLFVFLATLDMNVYLIWEDAGQCNLAWEDDATDEGWLVTAPCADFGADEPSAIVCTLTDAQQTCNKCNFNDLRDDDDDVCVACDVSARDVRCADPMAAPTDDPDSGTSNASATICAAECMAQEGATCCTTCGCEGEIVCTPPCMDGLLWDCEFQCCFDYEALACPSSESESESEPDADSE